MKKMLAILTMLAVVATLIVGCSANASATTGTSSQTSGAPVQLDNLVLAVTDAPPSSNVTSILVTVSAVQVHEAGAGETPGANETMGANIAGAATPIFKTSGNKTTGVGTPIFKTTGNKTTGVATPILTTGDNTTGSTSGSTTTGTPTADSGWINIPLGSNGVTFDLLNLQGIVDSIGAANLSLGSYTQVRLDITSVKVGLNGAAPVAATLPSNVLRVVQPFKIGANQTTSLLFDFDAAKMVTVTGNGKVIVKPVVKLTVSNKAVQ